MANVIIPNFNSQKTEVGLNTYQYTIINSGVHTAKIRVSVHQSSTLTITISQSGSTSATLATVTHAAIVQPDTTGQSSIVLSALANFVSGDVVSFALSSSAVTDNQLNNVKADMIVKQGSNT